MDRVEAITLLRNQVEMLRRRSYSELLEYLSNATAIEVVGDSGQEYQIEMEAIWDNESKSDLRVVISIDDGSLRWSIAPINESFIVRPDGSFVGE